MEDKPPVSLSIKRVFSDAGIDPYSALEWELRTAQIADARGNIIFEQKDVEVPKPWSQIATNIIASKYLHGRLGGPERETGVRTLVHRVVDTITESGDQQGYFKDAEEKETFRDELAALMLTQRASFNSPVWFNVGCHKLEPGAEAANWHWNSIAKKVVKASVGYHRPQCSACFINAVEDSMEGIMQLATTEALLFKFGSGTGTNFSSLRSSRESVSGGGSASGPLSFMKGLDAFAGVIKSGGKTRRAAKMAILNVSHPDIADFIQCKQKEEAKAYALMREGYDGSSGPDSEAYSSIFYQNANNSVRVTDEFMQAAEKGEDWTLVGVNDKKSYGTIPARSLMRMISEATWWCGDPGMQYDTTINKWHTSKNTDRINASNPCSEYMFLDDSACNLASLNLMKFLRKNGSFDAEAFKAAVRVVTTAMDIIVDLSGYPTEKIAKNSHDYRPLGLGYANLGALLMALGIPYDSEDGRAYAACVTAIMCGEAYAQSARMAGSLKPLASATGLKPGLAGACPGYFPNKEPFADVIMEHWHAATAINTCAPEDLRKEADGCWEQAFKLGEMYGYRNAQTTVLAPTGTIGFMMDCDTTGIEPELALVKYKKLVGGGMIKIVNETVQKALHRLGYRDGLLQEIVEYISQHGMVEGSAVAKHHLAVFDTSFKPAEGTRSIHYLGHLRMMAATQPFLSGAISKTINMPEEATIEEIEAAYYEGWRLGLKAVAIYRDGSKKNQVLVTRKEEHPSDVPAEQEDQNRPPRAVRHRLPDDRNSFTHKFSIAGHDGYLHVGLYPNGQPGEIFITMAKEGSTISGLMDALALSISVALQHGVPLQTIVEKLSHTRFEPSGWTKNKAVGYAKSITDYIARYLEEKFLKPKQEELVFTEPVLAARSGAMTHASEGMAQYVDLGDAPPCSVCGAIMVRNGSCYRCLECGSTSGCS